MSRPDPSASTVRSSQRRAAASERRSRPQRSTESKAASRRARWEASRRARWEHVGDGLGSERGGLAPGSSPRSRYTCHCRCYQFGGGRVGNGGDHRFTTSGGGEEHDERAVMVGERGAGGPNGGGRGSGPVHRLQPGAHLDRAGALGRFDCPPPP